MIDIQKFIAVIFMLIAAGAMFLQASRAESVRVGVMCVVIAIIVLFAIIPVVMPSVQLMSGDHQ